LKGLPRDKTCLWIPTQKQARLREEVWPAVRNCLLVTPLYKDGLR
jgi:hypothetical protein